MHSQPCQKSKTTLRRHLACVSLRKHDRNAVSIVQRATSAVAGVRAAPAERPKQAIDCEFRERALAHIADLYTYAHFLMLEPVGAEDAVHECYLKALLNYDGSNPDFRLWMLAMLRMICHRDLIRRGAYASAIADEDAALAIGPHGADEVIAAAAKPRGVRMDNQAKRLVASLPLPAREAIVLRECLRLTYGEISKVSGVSMTIVATRVAQARKILRHRGLLTSH